MVDSNAQVIGWIREAYPEGIDDTDAAPLLATLRQRLGANRTLQIALALVASGGLAAEQAAAASSPHSPIPQSDLRRVGSRLVMGGWPLSSPGAEEDDDTDEGSYLGRIVAWLREGYPQGVPDHDYIPLLALLERRLSKGEVKRVAKALRRAEISPAGPEEIAAAIADVTNSEATEDDMRRVRERLAAKGWPVDFPDPEANS